MQTLTAASSDDSYQNPQCAEPDGKNRETPLGWRCAQIIRRPDSQSCATTVRALESTDRRNRISKAYVPNGIALQRCVLPVVNRQDSVAGVSCLPPDRPRVGSRFERLSNEACPQRVPAIQSRVQADLCDAPFDYLAYRMAAQAGGFDYPADPYRPEQRGFVAWAPLVPPVTANMGSWLP